ncbi:MAG: patatin-like phospholipase family protein [Flavobacteriales bacterium]
MTASFLPRLIPNYFRSEDKHLTCSLILGVVLFVGSCFQPVKSQSVGLVLSGGGAKGLAHVGVLKALEENGIPIDYITGNSAGALIGGLYAAGYSPAEIETLLLSEKFRAMAEGKLEDNQVYYFKKKEDDPSWVSLWIRPDSLLQNAIPANLITPALLDFEMMLTFAGADAACKKNFDSLLVPFRCVASDIVQKRPLVFDKGNLNQIIRASMSYPFYLKPIEVDGKLLFDGGLYNNFPVDVMMDEFLPDVIIGSLVTGNSSPPDDENLRLQLENMIVTLQDFNIHCDQGVIIKPDIAGLSSFDFSRIKVCIDAGYNATLPLIDSLKKLIYREIPVGEMQKARERFLKKVPEISFSDITVNGLKPRQKQYVLKTLKRRSPVLTASELKSRYFKVYSDDKIRFIFPLSEYDAASKSYKLRLNIKKEKEFNVHFGGNFSNRPISTGFVGVHYHYLGKASWTFSGSSSFGRFYTSAHGSIKLEPAARHHYAFEPEISYQRWDYFRSNVFFFADEKPSYIVQDELFGGLNFHVALSTKGKFTVSSCYAKLSDRYYQTDDFTSIDTTDVTDTYAITAKIGFERNSLNRKQFASEGSLLKLSGIYVNALERTIPGSTSTIKDTTERYHNWPVIKIEYHQYFFRKSWLNIGFHFESVTSFQGFYNNYTASTLIAPGFAPFVDSKTYFFKDYRAHKYVAAGVEIVYNMFKNFEWRTQVHGFQPLNSLVPTQNNQTEYSDFLLKRFILGSTALVYQSPVGPVSISANFYQNQQYPFTFLFNAGFIIFNRKAIL